MARGRADARQPARTSVRPDLRTPRRTVAALTIAVLVAAGAAMGSINLLVDDVIRPGEARWVYGATMLLLVAVAGTLGLRRRIGPWTIFGLVLLGDLTYLVIALSITDPLRYATPLMMLFAAFVAAWFLDGWMLATHLVVTPAIVAIALVRPTDGEDPVDGLWRLLDSADAAMYDAKQAGRDRVAAALTPHPRRAPAAEGDLPIEPPVEPADPRVEGVVMGADDEASEVA